MFLRIFLIFITNFCLADELKSVTVENFIAENPTKARTTILDNITNQFKNKSVSQAELNSAWNNIEARNTLYMARFQIVDQKIYAAADSIHRSYFRNFLEYLQKLIQTHKVNDVDFIIFSRDEIPYNHNLDKKIFEVPTFMFSKNMNTYFERDRLLIPDAFIITPKWRTLIQNLGKAELEYPWQSKIEKYFWRGATTGVVARYYYNIDNFDKLTRLKLAMFSKLYPDLIDAKFVDLTFSNDQSGKNLDRILTLLSCKDIPVKEEDHLRYKYLLAVDGGTAPWLRVPWIMYSNSLLIKQETANIEWFYHALEPYVHYIPVREDLTDIFEQLDWIKTHDQEAKQISQNAHNFVVENLMPEHIDSYVVITLNEYSKIQQDKKIIPTLPKAEDVFSLPALIKNLVNQVIRKWFN